MTKPSLTIPLPREIENFAAEVDTYLREHDWFTVIPFAYLAPGCGLAQWYRDYDTSIDMRVGREEVSFHADDVSVLVELKLRFSE